jgi:hypothetical protein
MLAVLVRNFAVFRNHFAVLESLHPKLFFPQSNVFIPKKKWILYHFWLGRFFLYKCVFFFHTPWGLFRPIFTFGETSIANIKCFSLNVSQIF